MSQSGEAEGAEGPQWSRKNPLVALDEAWLHEFIDSSIGKVSQLSISPVGGLVNSNYRIDTDQGRLFLRLTTGDRNGAPKEVALLDAIRNESPDAPIPETLAVGQFKNYPITIQNWIEGITLKQAVREASPDSANQLGHAVGETLPSVSRVGYDQHGFLDENGALVAPFRLHQGGYREYLYLALEQSYQKFGAQLVDQVWKYADANAPLMDSLSAETCLIHGDLHPNNILVNGNDEHWKVVGIVDWESALSWNPCHDLAHLLRRSFPNRDEFEQGLLDGFRQSGGSLPQDWNGVRKLLQLLGWMDKLATAEDRPEVIATAVQSVRFIVGADSPEI